MVKTFFCTQCGKEIPEEAKFCLSCGAPQEIPSKSEPPPEPEREQLTPPSPPPSSSITSPPPGQSPKKSVSWAMIGAVVVVILVVAGIFFVLTSSPTSIPLPGASPTATPASVNSIIPRARSDPDCPTRNRGTGPGEQEQFEWSNHISLLRGAGAKSGPFNRHNGDKGGWQHLRGITKPCCTG